jgi:Tol biopolymer transport system component
MLTLALISVSLNVIAQKLDKLTVGKIMRDPKWIGTSPSNLSWSNDGKTLYFSWNPEQATSDSLYYITLDNKNPVKATTAQKRHMATINNTIYNQARTAYIYASNGDVFITELKPARTRRITQTLDNESNPQFSFNDAKVVYTRNSNLYAWDIATGETQQLTNLRSEQRPRKRDTTQQEQWLIDDQLQYFEILRQRKQKR